MIKYTKFSLKYAIIALALLLAACGDENSATPTPTPTPTQSVIAQPAVARTQGDGQEAAATITSLITATLAAPVASQPAPSPTATEIQQPADLLQRGERWLRYGDFAAARKDFQTVIENPASTPDLQLQATFDLARAYRADGMFEQALVSLEMFNSAKIENSTVASQLAPKVWLLRGELQQSIGDPSTTIESMRQVLALYPWAEELIQSEIASAQAQVGNVDESVKAYRAAASKATTDVARASWLEQSARANSSGSRHSDAIADLDAILSFAKQPDYRADLQYRVGQLYATAGNEASAIERWFLATKESADSQSAYLALVELINREVPFDPYLRAKIDLQAEAWFPAINAYQIFLESVPISDTRHAIALHELGLSQLGAEDVDAAIATFDRVITQFPQCTCLGQTWMDKARAQVIRGDSSGARRSYRTFAREHPTDPLAPEALWQSGIRALRDDNRIEAAADFLALSDAFPESERAPFALYAVATGAFQGGFYTQAANLYKRLQEDYPDQLAEAVSYWLGRSWDAHGEKDEAKRVWQELIGEAPDSYYGVLAAAAQKQLSRTNSAFLLEMRTIAGPPSRLAGDDGSQAFAEKWLDSWMQQPKNISGVLSDTVAGDVDLLQGRLLLNVDRRYEGLLYLNRVFDRYKGDPGVLYPLSLEFERIGAYRLSISSMQLVLQKSPARLVEDAPIFLQKKLYPQPFAELIVKEAQAQKFDPLLYFSLIRQESLFEEGARSGAAAQGLAQIIPDTGHWVAQQLGHPDWSNELIYRPYINLQFGAYYLNWTRDYLDGNLVSALVGYNAGPGNAEYWREISGADDALFVEILAVNEPRIYVQIITNNLYHYTRLYGK